ncbi:cuticle protein 21-like [Penaeus chinensis]|uniref:cuticle protein 21-like n=1 Tax=Penaeus chinensis TaxID=139456 RepID=UPI001FB6DFE5|nr:cuticle protein 21-like [Penaeus chinensis]
MKYKVANSFMVSQELRNGYNTKGSYYALLPDGRLQVAYVVNSFFHKETAVALGLVAVTLASPSQPYYRYALPATYGAPVQYGFNYAAKDDYTNNNFDHQETRNGYDTQGSYYVLLPDGHLQKVAYTVNGDSGYVDEAQYPEYHSATAYKPAYKPAPTYT